MKHHCTDNTTHNKSSERNLSVELLRVVFMLMILLLHYLIHGLGHHANEYVNTDHASSFPLEMALIGVCNIGVTGFMFISGYYGIKYRPSRLFALWLQTAFYFLCLTLITGFISGHMHYFTLAKFWLPFTNGSWWFLMCYAFVYILSPIINNGIKHIDQKEFKWILILTGFMLYVGKFLAFALSTEFILLLFIYMTGRYFKMYGWSMFERHSTTIFLTGATILTVIPYILGQYEISKLLKVFFSNYNPVVAMTAISLFFTVIHHSHLTHMHPLLLSLCSNTFAAYIITDYVPLREWLIEHFVTPYGHSLIHAAICVVIGLVACMLIEECRKKLMSPVIKAADKHLTQY